MRMDRRLRPGGMVFFDCYCAKMIALDAKPNAAHRKLAVYPAAGLLQYFRGDHLAIVNRDPTPSDCHVDLVIHGSIGEALDY